jgi:hypothetical protein
MREYSQKGLIKKPPRDFYAPLEAFALLGGLFHG